jgi:hypothetical protein
VPDQETPDEGELGYTFHPQLYPQAPGHPQLDIVLRATPTGLHFDPKWVRLPVASANRGIELLTVRHPWQWKEHYRACEGHVSLHDHKNKVIEAFAFGGDLQIMSEEDRTTCILSSSAPIVEMLPEPLTRGPSVHMMLVEEVEALIAQRRAAWDQEQAPIAFDRRLAAVDPLRLYLACLGALNEKFAHFPHGAEDELTHQFIVFLHAESKALHEMGTWPLYVPPLAELL